MTPAIIEKIKKLLRLGKDSAATQAEAELAIKRAFELASEYQIEIETISLEDDIRRIVSEEFPVQARLSFARKKILNLLVAFFNVNVIINRVRARCFPILKPTVTFIGKPVDIQIARYVYDYLHTTCATCLKTFCAAQRRRPARSTQESFIQGFVYGVSSTLKAVQAELPESQNALIVSERGRRDQTEADQYKKQSLKPVKSELSRYNRDATLAGFIQGEKVQIRKPIATNAAGQLLLA